jgi:hypothetical protein
MKRFTALDVAIFKSFYFQPARSSACMREGPQKTGASGSNCGSAHLLPPDLANVRSWTRPTLREVRSHGKTAEKSAAAWQSKTWQADRRVIIAAAALLLALSCLHRFPKFPTKRVLG